MDLKISNKHFIVCGAGKGLGEAVAKALLDEGALVHGITRTEGTMQELENAFPETFFPVYADIYDSSTHQRLLADFENKELAGVVFNAGGPPATSALETTTQQWDDAYRTVFRWKVELTKLLLPKMMQQESGRLLFLESISVKQPAANLVLSNAMRSAVISWMKTLANEIGSSGITCNAIATGFHATGAMGRVFKKAAETSGSSLEDARKNLEKQVPARRLGTADDFGSLAAWMLSAHSGYLTGQTISIDGGLVKGLFG